MKKWLILTNNEPLSNETKEKIRLLVEKEMKENGYKQDQVPLIIEIRKIARSLKKKYRL